VVNKLRQWKEMESEVESEVELVRLFAFHFALLTLCTLEADHGSSRRNDGRWTDIVGQKL
jgi:hypothetical protein